MTDELTSALRQLLKIVVHEVAGDLVAELRASGHHQSPQTLAEEGLLLTPRETAKRLAISERHLFQLTRSGQLPCIRVGKCVRYSVETIQKWVREVESKAQPPTTKTHSPKTASSSPKPVATKTDHSKPKHAAGQKKLRPAREKPCLEEGRSPQASQTTPNGRTKAVSSQERISPLSVLLSELGIDRSSLPSITNGDLRRIAEVDIATMHGWLYLNRSLPEDAVNRLKNHFFCLKERQVG